MLSHLAEIITLTLKKLAKENESCQNYILQVLVNHHDASNRPASWSLNVRQAAKRVWKLYTKCFLKGLLLNVSCTEGDRDN